MNFLWSMSTRNIGRKIMNQQQNEIPHSSVIKWKTGSPVKYTKCLVLCKHNGKYVIHDDVWFGNIRGWQSCWHGMIAWCAYEDITHASPMFTFPPTFRYRPLRYPSTEKWYKSFGVFMIVSIIVFLVFMIGLMLKFGLC